MIQNNTKKLLITFFSLILIFGFILYKFGPRYTVANDGIVKLIQAVSLIKNNFTTKKLYYPAVDIDPEYKYFPFHDYLDKREGKYIGPYPIMFSVISAALLKVFPIASITIFCLIFSFLILFIFQKYWKPDLMTLIIAAIGTPILFMGLAYSEHSLLLLFQVFGLSLYFKNNDTKKWTAQLSGGFFLSFGIWIRLEVIIFIPIFIFALLLQRYKFHIINFFKNEFIFIIGLSIPLISFMIYNYYDYGHVLGSYYTGNVSGFYKSIETHVYLFTVMLFGWKNQLGFFGYMPIFLVMLLYLIRPKNFNFLNEKEKIFFWCSIIFIPAIGIVSPSDGISN